MPIININLLQEQQSRVLRLNQANVVVGVVCGAIVALLLLVTVFLYSTIALRNAEKDRLAADTAAKKSLIGDADKVSSGFYPKLTLTQQATVYQSQVDAAKTLIDNHKYFSLYLSEMAINTPTTVVYNSFGIDSQNKLTVTGIATDYPQVSQLAEKFKNLSFATAANIQDAKLETVGISQSSQQTAGPCPTPSTKPPNKDCTIVKFTLQIELKSAAELNKLPGPGAAPSPGPVRSTNSPAPRTSPSPRPSGSR